MEKKKVLTKLSLNKKTIASLNKEEMWNVKGGAEQMTLGGTMCQCPNTHACPTQWQHTCCEEDCIIM